jgi:hypothetical protein
MGALLRRMASISAALVAGDDDLLCPLHRKPVATLKWQDSMACATLDSQG